MLEIGCLGNVNIVKGNKVIVDLDLDLVPETETEKPPAEHPTKTEKNPNHAATANVKS